MVELVHDAKQKLGFVLIYPNTKHLLGPLPLDAQGHVHPVHRFIFYRGF
jgi:hypothetical protein